MTSASAFWEVGSTVLGYAGTVASWRRPTALYKNRYQCQLVIQSASVTDEGVYTPAESVTLNTRESLLALRSAIDEALKETP